MDDKRMDERRAETRNGGFDVAMAGVWKGDKGRCHFVFFDTEHATDTCFESIGFSNDREDLGFQRYPGPPSEVADEDQMLA